MILKTYGETLKHPKWQKKRLEILERDFWTCTACSRGDVTLHVHHKKYVSGKKPWEYENENFVTLCEECHVEFEKGLDYLEKNIKRIIRSGISNPFNLKCMVEVLKNHGSLDELFYMLWEDITQSFRTRHNPEK